MPPYRRPLLLLTSLVTLAALGACRNPEAAQVSEQPDGLASNDPAVRSAVNGDIMVDPARTGQSNAAAVANAAQPGSGGVPALSGGGTAAEAIADARRAVGGQMLRAPAPSRYEENCDSRCEQTAAPRPATLGGLARQQGGTGCGADIRYGNEWASRLPPAFTVYPRAALIEAAGVANGRCNVRVVNFQSRADMQSILDYYYTQAQRAGYSAEHLLRGSEHYLGGTRGDEAFVIMARQMAGGIVDVDLIASGGR